MPFFLCYIYAFGEPDAEGGYSVRGLQVIVPIIFWGLVTVGFETELGATLGNLLVGLKAIPQNGTNRKLTFGESFKRHLLDPVDLFLFGLIGIVTMKNQRLGDIWGNTIVVRSKKLNK